MSKDPTSVRQAKSQHTRRYWMRSDRPAAGWWPAGWIPVVGLVGAFLYGLIDTAPAIESATQARVAATLADNGFGELEVLADGQEVLVRGAGSAVDAALVSNQVSAVQCETWIAGTQVCPNTVRVELTETVAAAPAAAPPPVPAVAEPVAHEIVFAESDTGISISGRVPGAAVRSGILATARATYDNVTDDLVVTNEVATDGFDWAVDRAWPLLRDLSDGRVAWQNEILSASGSAAAQDEVLIREYFAASSFQERLGELTFERPSPAETCNELLADALANSTIRFQTSSAEIVPESRDLIERLAGLARECAVPLTIDGHTDNVGPDAINEPLSLARAQAVAAAFATLGVDSASLTARGFGAQQPIADNASREGRARNRRIEIRATAVSQESQ